MVSGMTDACQEFGGKAVRADLQGESAIPGRHEPDRNKGSQRIRHHKEAGKPPALTQ
jgi:hypothetical protein